MLKMVKKKTFKKKRLYISNESNNTNVKNCKGRSFALVLIHRGFTIHERLFYAIKNIVKKCLKNST